MKERDNNILYIVLVVMLIMAGIAINEQREKSKNDEYIDLLYKEEYQLVIDGEEINISNMSREDIIDLINQNNCIVEIKDGLKQIQVNEFVISDEDRAKSEKSMAKVIKICSFVVVIISMVGMIAGFMSVMSRKNRL